MLIASGQFYIVEYNSAYKHCCVWRLPHLTPTPSYAFILVAQSVNILRAHCDFLYNNCRRRDQSTDTIQSIYMTESWNLTILQSRAQYKWTRTKQTFLNLYVMYMFICIWWTMRQNVCLRRIYIKCALAMNNKPAKY